MEAAGGSRQQFYPISCTFRRLAQNYIQLDFTEIRYNYISTKSNTINCETQPPASIG